MIKIALTGNIASGKSTAEKIISDMGFKVYDLDIVSHNLLEGDCKNDILKEFNTIDRKTLADIVFKDKEKLKKLENIIYPKLKEFILNTFEKYKDEKAVFISGALIIEKGFKDYFDKIIFIDAPYELRLQRLIKRNGYTQDEAKLRLDAQSDASKKLADWVVENDGEINILKEKINKMLKFFLSQD